MYWNIYCSVDIERALLISLTLLCSPLDTLNSCIA